MMIHTASPGFVRLMNSSISQHRFVFLVMLSLLSVTLEKNKLVRQNTGPVLVLFFLAHRTQVKFLSDQL